MRKASKRYIAMTCHTDNPEAEKAYLHFVEKIEPELKPRHFKLDQVYLAHPARDQTAAASATTFSTATPSSTSNCSARKMFRWKPRRRDSASNIRNSAAR